MNAIKTLDGKDLPIGQIDNVMVMPVFYGKAKPADFRVDVFCITGDGSWEQHCIRFYKRKDASFQHYKRAAAYREALLETLRLARQRKQDRRAS